MNILDRLWAGGRWWRRKRKPIPPKGLRIVRPGGIRIPATLVYLGKDSEGLDEWEIAQSFNLMTDELEADVIPPRTAIRFSGTVSYEDF